nr:hypothetical protein [uncultured Blautia sp.]
MEVSCSVESSGSVMAKEILTSAPSSACFSCFSASFTSKDTPCTDGTTA